MSNGIAKPRGILLSDDQIREALAGTLQNIRLPPAKSWRSVRAGDVLFVKESFDDVHPVAVQDGRYSREGCAGIPGPPPVKYRAVYRIDGPTPPVYRTHTGYPYRSTTKPADCLICKGGECQYKTVCSDHHLTKPWRQFWYPARECDEFHSRLNLHVLRIEGDCAHVRAELRP